MSDDVTPAPVPRTPLLGSVWLYHPRGVKVQLPVPAGAHEGAEFACSPALALAAVDDYLAAGWLTDAPGLEAGEHKEEVGYVLRRSKDNQDGSETPIIDLYSSNDQLTWKVLSVYLNTDDDVAAFERAAGVRLTDIPLFSGTAAPERGASKQSDKFITRTRPFGVVWGANPKYDEAAAQQAAAANKRYTVPKKKFVRWADQPAGKPAAGGEQQQADPSLNANAFSQWWADFLAPAPPLDALNGRLSDLADIPAGPVKDRIKHAIAAYAKRCGWQFDKQAGRYAEPQPAAAADNEIPF